MDNSTYGSSIWLQVIDINIAEGNTLYTIYLPVRPSEAAAVQVIVNVWLSVEHWISMHELAVEL